MGLVCLNWEDAETFVAAGQEAQVPVILQAGPGARAHMPVSIWGAMFRELGARADIPVVAHLDHGGSLEECEAALQAGFTSIMYDGSRLPLEENLRSTAEAAKMARAAGASIEAEIGFVGYADGQSSDGTNVGDARAMAALDIDALAVSVGNVHLQQGPLARIDWDLAQALSQVARQPLVIHGGSGVAAADRARLAREFGVAKINVGTELRQTYGETLRCVLAQDQTLFDRLAIAKAIRPKMVDTAAKAMAEAWG